MGQERKYFGDTSFRLNADDAAFAVGLNEIVNSENVRTQTTDAGVTGVIESIGSNAILTQDSYSSGTDVENGSCSDPQNGRFVKFIYNPTSSLHRITCVYPALGIEYVVLLASQVTGGLNFSLNSPIHSAQIVNGYLYWPDSTNNQPRKVNIESGILLNNPTFVTTQPVYVSPLAFSEITMVKPPPIYAPTISKVSDLSDRNLIAPYSFEFAFQYQYWDNEITVPGTYSVGSRPNFDVAYVPFNYNTIQVYMSTSEFIPNSVRIVNLVCRLQDGSPEGGNIGVVINSWDKLIPSQATAIYNQNNLLGPLGYTFDNSNTGLALSPDEVLRIADLVPLFSQTLSFAKNRLFPGNNISGYPTPTTTSMAVTQNSSSVSMFVAPFYYNVFLAYAAYNFGIQFYDFAMRPVGGVVTNASLGLKTPQYVNPLNTGSPFSAVTSMSWTLSNASAAAEIPLQAYYYSPVRTLNLRTRNLVTSVSTAPKYATLDTNGNYVFTSTTYTNNVVALALDTASLIQAKLGYVFTQGDLCTLWGSPGFPATYEITIIGQSGGYI